MNASEIKALSDTLVPTLGPEGAAVVIAAMLHKEAAIEIRRGLERIADKIYMA